MRTPTENYQSELLAARFFNAPCAVALFHCVFVVSRQLVERNVRNTFIFYFLPCLDQCSFLSKSDMDGLGYALDSRTAVSYTLVLTVLAIV